MTDSRLIVGDCRDVMRDLIAQGVQVQTCVTSPPYYGLRSYPVPNTVWGGAADCAHEWGDKIRIHKGGPCGGSPCMDGRSVKAVQNEVKNIDAGRHCIRCGAWLGQIGLEPTYPMYVAHMVEVFDLVRALLADDGVLWLNLGDSYATGAGGGRGQSPGGGAQGEKWRGGSEGKHGKVGPMTQPNRMPQPGLKQKDLMGIPWRVAFALQDAGWWLRQDNIWQKPNPMPDSAQDRFCKNHEYVFQMTKSARYYFDLEAVLEPCVSGPSDVRKMLGQQDRIGGKCKALDDPLSKASAATNIGRKRGVGGLRRSGNKERKYGEERDRPGSHLGASIPWEGLMRTPRTVWTIATVPFKGAHFATMPPKLVERCVLAGSRPGDIVFDPFFGSGTVGEVAERLGRRWLGIELSPEYEPLSRERTKQRGFGI